jgi:hypothetical protein
METIVQAGWNEMTVRSVPIDVNPKTRDSRLVKSVPRYIFHSSTSIIRSFALYKPFRFFFAVGLVPFTVGVVLLLRWIGLYVLEEEYRSRVPSLVVGIGLLLLAVQTWAVAFLADLQAANRRVLQELRLRSKQLEYADLDRASEPGDPLKD